MITVISDTHAKSLSELPDEVLKSMERSDYVIHAGDFDTYEFFKELDRNFDLICVRGNCDPFELPEFEVFEGIGIRHEPDEFMVYKALELGLKVIVFGHTHLPYLERVKGVVLLNPGSPTVPKVFSTFAEIRGNEIVVRRVGGADLFRLKIG